LEDIFNNLAKRMYELLVVNPYAIAIQQNSGAYITKYVPFDDSLLRGMLEKRGAAGCYQQGFFKLSGCARYYVLDRIFRAAWDTCLDCIFKCPFQIIGF